MAEWRKTDEIMPPADAVILGAWWNRSFETWEFDCAKWSGGEWQSHEADAYSRAWHPPAYWLPITLPPAGPQGVERT